MPDGALVEVDPESDPPCLRILATRHELAHRWLSREPGLAALLPGIVAALSFSAADILGKIVFNDGMDVLSFITTRGVLTVLFFWFWLRHAPPARATHQPRTHRRPSSSA